MTRDEVIANYRVENGRIVSPGKFEGEPVFAPHFWEMGLDGMADRNDGKGFTFRFAFATTDADEPWRKELQEWLGNKRTLNMSEDDQGFVHCF